MMSADVRKELLECSICLTVYTDPVTLKCGHNFCLGCIDHVLDTQEGSGVYSCPECRAGTVKRPALVRNITLCYIVETFPSPPYPPPDPESGILCSYCLDGSPVPAVRSCILCEASLCDKHLRVHSKSPEHVLTDPTASLRNKKCAIHREIIKYFCIQDAACICVSCRLDGDHRGHEVEKLNEASEKRKEKLRNNIKELIIEREEIEKKIQSLQEKMGEVLIQSASVKERVASLVGDLRRQLDDLEKRAQCDISRQEEQISHSLSDSIHQLEIKKDALSRKMHHIEELCNTTDPLTVLRASDTPDSQTLERDNERGEKTPRDGGDLDVTVLSQTLGALANLISGIKIGICTEGPVELILDVNTAHNDLSLSNDRKTVIHTTTFLNQIGPGTPERFQTHYNILSCSSFSSGPHYWEAVSSDLTSWRIGMSYANMERKGDQSWFGKNEKSWCLVRHKKKYHVSHNNKEIPLSHSVSSNRVRVCLNYEAGKLSFYELSDRIQHLHTFTTTFTQPLHAAICLYREKEMFVCSRVKILDEIELRRLKMIEDIKKGMT